MRCEACKQFITTSILRENNASYHQACFSRKNKRSFAGTENNVLAHAGESARVHAQTHMHTHRRICTRTLQVKGLIGLFQDSDSDSDDARGGGRKKKDKSPRKSMSRSTAAVLLLLLLLLLLLRARLVSVVCARNDLRVCICACKRRTKAIG